MYTLYYVTPNTHCQGFLYIQSSMLNTVSQSTRLISFDPTRKLLFSETIFWKMQSTYMRVFYAQFHLGGRKHGCLLTAFGKSLCT
jgi:hypothetical protein